MRDFKVNDQDNSFLSEAEKIPKGFKMVDVLNPHDLCTNQVDISKEDCILFKGELIRAKHGFGFIFNFTTTETLLIYFLKFISIDFFLQYIIKKQKRCYQLICTHLYQVCRISCMIAALNLQCFA